MNDISFKNKYNPYGDRNLYDNFNPILLNVVTWVKSPKGFLFKTTIQMLFNHYKKIFLVI